MKKWLGFLLIIMCIPIFAAKKTCPSETQIKNVKFIHATQDPYDADVWNFISDTFSYQNKDWNVAYGSFFEGVKTEEEALKVGQTYYDKEASVIIKYPRPIDIPNHTICEYTPTGRLYWIAALTPPETTPATKR